MKSVLVFFCALALTQAINWDKVERLEINRPAPIALPRFQHRIVNGEEVVPHSAPHQVALLIKMKGQDGTAFCGGSLISNNYVLTAAHCIQPAESVEVVLGAHRVKDESEASQVRMTSTTFAVHPKWSRFTLKNDLAIVKLPESVQENENIRIIGLPSKSGNHNIDSETVSVTGWGKDSDAATTVSEVLRRVTVPILPNGKCNLFYFGIITDTHVCTDSWTGSIGEGRSTCSGDSGGPLILENQTQVGIVSFGIALGCELGWPAAYTRVSEYLDWLEQNTDAKINA